jgi:hypothetical protein
MSLRGSDEEALEKDIVSEQKFLHIKLFMMQRASE